MISTLGYRVLKLWGVESGEKDEKYFLGLDEVDREKISARYDNGVLRLTIPKSEKAQPRKIVVEA